MSTFGARRLQTSTQSRDRLGALKREGGGCTAQRFDTYRGLFEYDLSRSRLYQLRTLTSASERSKRP